MKFVFLCLAALVLSLGQVFAVVKTSNGGAWSNGGAGGTWSPVGLPGINDDVIIASGTTTVDMTATVKSLTINGTAILDFNTNNQTITVTLTTTMNGNSLLNNSGGAGNTRILNMLGDFIIPAGQAARIDGITMTQPIAKNFTVSGSFQPTNNAGTKTLGNLIVNNGGTWTATTNEIYTFQGNADLYEGCLISGASTGRIFVNGNLTVRTSAPAGSHAQLGQITMRIDGTTTVIGYLEFANSSSGTKTFSNTITVAVGGTWDNTVGEDPVVNCDIVNNGNWPVPSGASNGRYAVNDGGSHTWSGPNTIGMSRLNITSGTVTNLGKAELTRANGNGLTSAGGLLVNGTGGYLKLTSQPTPISNTSNVDFTASDNIVDYAYAGDQDVFPTTYDKLESNNDGIKTCQGGTVANNYVKITGTTTLAVAGGTNLTGTANLIMQNTATLRLGYNSPILPELTGASNVLDAGTTIDFNGAGAFGLRRSSVLPYQNVLISGNVGSNANFSADGTGVTNILGDLTFTGAGRMTTNSAMTVGPMVADVGGHLIYTSTGSTTLTNDIVVGDFSISSGTFVYTGRKITINGSDGTWTNNGGVITQGIGSNVEFNTGTNQSISGSVVTTFRKLTINNANDVFLDNIDATVNNLLDLSQGRLITGVNTVFASNAVPASAVTRSAPATGFVEGNLKKILTTGAPNITYEVGTGPDYSPVKIIFSAGAVTVAGTLTASATDGNHPEIYSALFSTSVTVSRYWSLTMAGATFLGGSTYGLTFTYAAGDIQPALTDLNVTSTKGYNPAALSWSNATPMSSFVANPAGPATFNSIPVADLSAGQVDYQFGQALTPQDVFNRFSSGTGPRNPQNWSDKRNWIQIRTGTVVFTNGSSTVTSPTSTTKFTTELSVGDSIMLYNPAYAIGNSYKVTAIASDFSLTIHTNYVATATTPSINFGREYLPNNPLQDAVKLGNVFAETNATTISMNGNFSILTLDFFSKAFNYSLVHSTSTKSLTVAGNAAIAQPSADGVTNLWDIADGYAVVQGNLQIGTGANASLTRVSKVKIRGTGGTGSPATATSGYLSVSNLKFVSNNVVTAQNQVVLDMSGAAADKALLNIGGTIAYTTSPASINKRGTLTSNQWTSAANFGSTINFVRAVSTQAVVVPTNSTAAWVYNNILTNNTSALGGTIGFAVTTANVKGDIRVQTGRTTVANFAIAGNAGRTFEVVSPSTFAMIGTGGFPSGFGTFLLNVPVAGVYPTVEYSNTANTNIAAQAYGNLDAFGTTNQTISFTTTPITVSGNLRVGDGSTTPTLNQSGAAMVLNVNGDLTVNTGATLDGTNIATINLGKNWSDSGTFTPGTSAVVFNGLTAAQPQLITNPTGETFYNLTLNTDQNTDKVKMVGDVTVSNTLTLTNGGLLLNGNLLDITRESTGAIVRSSPSYILGENLVPTYGPAGSVRWLVDSQTGTFTWPFGKSETVYIPFSMNVTVAGNGNPNNTGTVKVFTYGTAADNQPIAPSGAGNLTGTSGGTSVVDRFWNIALSNYSGGGSARPVSTVTFTGTLAEFTGTGLNQNLANSFTTVPPQAAFAAQRWDPANYWDAAVPTQNYTPNIPASTGTVVMTGISSYDPAWAIANQAVPLPIELTEFNAEFQTGVVAISWRTESEVNNDFFVVQKTVDAERFEDIVQVKGAGTSTTPKRYSTYDSRLTPGKWYYRLKQTDYDGKFSYSKLVSVAVPESVSRVAYPNPSNGSEININFATSDIGRTAYVRLHDASGRELTQLYTESLTSANLKLEVPQKLSPGIYVISIAVDQEVVRQKLVVSK